MQNKKGGKNIDMDQLRHQKKEGSAVSDRLKFDVKPIAVRSENLVTSIKATNGNAYKHL